MKINWKEAWLTERINDNFDASFSRISSVRLLTLVNTGIGSIHAVDDKIENALLQFSDAEPFPVYV